MDKETLEKVATGCAQLYYGNLSNVDLSSIDLSYLPLAYAKLADANMRNARMHETNLKYANLEGADLFGAIIFGANMEGANLRHANMRETILISVNMRYVTSLESADLEGAVADRFTFWPPDFDTEAAGVVFINSPGRGGAECYPGMR